MKILLVSDVHGSSRVLEKISKLSGLTNTIAVAGDICPNHLVPIIDYGDFIGVVRGKDVVKLRNMEEALDYKEILSENGYIPWFGTKEEFEKLDKQKYYDQAQEEYLRILMKKLKSKFERVFIILGNDDYEGMEKLIEGKGIFNLNEKIVQEGGYEFAGMSFVPKTPFKTRFEVTDEELGKKVEDLVKKIKNPSKSVWIFHTPPHDTGLDVCIAVDENIRPVYKDKEPVFGTFGSKSIRTAIEKSQPLFYLCGHFHESPGTRNIGKTTCVNPGSEYENGILRVALIDLEKNHVEIWKL